jgi:hypothetical protein
MIETPLQRALIVFVEQDYIRTKLEKVPEPPQPRHHQRRDAGCDDRFRDRDRVDLLDGDYPATSAHRR